MGFRGFRGPAPGDDSYCEALTYLAPPLLYMLNVQRKPSVIRRQHPPPLSSSMRWSIHAPDPNHRPQQPQPTNPPR